MDQYETRPGRPRRYDADFFPHKCNHNRILEIIVHKYGNEGYGFLRTTGFRPSKQDAYVAVKQVKQFDLRRGDYLVGGARPANRSEKNPALLRLDTVNGNPPEDALKRPHFEDLTPLFPDERLNLELAADPSNMTARIVDLLSPIGKGQRGLIVSPPKAGKTTIMKQIARSIEKLLTDNNLREKLSKASLKRAHYFDWEKSANALVKVFENV